MGIFIRLRMSAPVAVVLFDRKEPMRAPHRVRPMHMCNVSGEHQLHDAVAVCQGANLAMFAFVVLYTRIARCIESKMP